MEVRHLSPLPGDRIVKFFDHNNTQVYEALYREYIRNPFRPPNSIRLISISIYDKERNEITYTLDRSHNPIGHDVVFHITLVLQGTIHHDEIHCPLTLWRNRYTVSGQNVISAMMAQYHEDKKVLQEIRQKSLNSQQYIIAGA